MLQTVVETNEYLKQAATCMSDKVREEFIDFIAEHPSSGHIIQGTGGARKVRCRKEGRGKRAGVRIIYYYHNKDMPIFLFTAYGKNQRATISESEKKELKSILKQLIVSYGRN